MAECRHAYVVRCKCSVLLSQIDYFSTTSNANVVFGFQAKSSVHLQSVKHSV